MQHSVHHGVAPAFPLIFLTLYSSSLDPFQLIPCRSFGEDVQVLLLRFFYFQILTTLLSKLTVFSVLLFPRNHSRSLCVLRLSS